MRLIAFLIVASLAPASAFAQWRVETSTDRLDPKNRWTYAITKSKQAFQQFGHDVQTSLIIACRDAITGDGSASNFKQLGAEFRFSETVATGERFIRWRVDEHKVAQRKTQFYDDGKTYYIYSYMGRDELPGQLKNAKIMRVDADLPWAGKVLLEFDVSGSAAAFAKIPCG